MRILLLSDIHANRPALEAIREEFDVCLFLGDLVDYGVEPGPCIDWVRKNARHAVRGNHDHGAAQTGLRAGRRGFRYLTGVTRPLTIERLATTTAGTWPGCRRRAWLTLDGKRYLLVHATPARPDGRVRPARRRTSGDAGCENIDADYVCVGHTHMQYMLQVGKTTVINPGSVGLPRDGDPRAGLRDHHGRRARS